MQKTKRITLMCDSGCCPRITLSEDKIFIEDDFGGKVKLTKEQFELLKEKVKKEEG